MSSSYKVRQLFDTTSSTYTYLVYSKNEAVIIDTVKEHAERDAKLINELGLDLLYVADTHVHADHVTAAAKLLEKFPKAKYCVSHNAEMKNSIAQPVKDGDKLQFGDSFLLVVETPGHTNTCVTYVANDNKVAFTGDALFVRGCGRTDFQSGSSDTLFHSIREKLFKMLPGDCIVYIGHDYKGFTCTTIDEEKKYNPRLGEHVSKEQFAEIMANLNLPPPKLLSVALPANLAAGADSA
jgi:sulfur dioxygenase